MKFPVGMRLAVAAAASCLLVTGLATSPAAAADAGGKLTAKLSVTVGSVSPAGTHAGSSVPVIPGCNPGLGQYNRTQVCWPDGFYVTIYNSDGEPVGETEFTLIEDLQLNPDGRSFSQKIWVYYVDSTGEAPAVWDMAFFATCDNACEATDHFPEGAPLEVGTAGSISYYDGVAAGKTESDHTSEDLTISAEDVTPVSWPWETPTAFRCDDDLSPLAVDNVISAASSLDPAGCVFPKYIPTLTLPISTYGASAAMIQWAQQHLSGEWGLKSKNKPLNRLGNPAQAKANQKKVCQTAWKTRPQVPSDSCDEYPFAASQQSAGLLKGFTSGAACAQVTAVEKAGKWNAVEPLGKYSASDKCVRGHIPLSQNKLVGSKYGGFVGSERLLPGDPFWVAVSS